MANAHIDVQRFDFHAGNLTTACRAEASSEGGMKHGLPRRNEMKAGRTRIFLVKNLADNAAKRGKLKTNNETDGQSLFGGCDHIQRLWGDARDGKADYDWSGQSGSRRRFRRLVGRRQWKGLPAR
jgi:hypothetical protein